MKIIKLIVKTNNSKYPILIGANLTKKIPKILNENSIKFNNCLLVIDKNISSKIISDISKNFKKKKIYKHFFKANEKNKNQKNVDKILKILLEKNFSRNDCLISIGGGITGDITGFAASLFKRGLQFVNIPTTLLSQVDSSVGGKTGINTKQGKNMIGSFYQPKIVLSDINFLKTLPKRQIVCGYGEIIKHSLIANKKFFKFLDKNVNNILKIKSPFLEKAIYESCKIKMQVVSKDEKELNLRKILNFGHTFGHAYEATLKYSTKLNHGEAVILGMKTAIKFSYRHNFLNNNEFLEITNHLNKKDFPSKIKDYFFLKDINKIISFMMMDKKNNSNKIELMLIKKIGYPILNKKFNKNMIKFFLKNELIN